MSAATPRHLPLLGLAFVLYSQLAMAIEVGEGAVRIAFLGIIGVTLLLERSGQRIQVTADRSRVFATVGIVGYVFFGLSQLDLRSAEPRVDAFFTGLVLVFTVHQLGAILRLGQGGDRGPIYVVSAIHMLGAANAQERSPTLPWVIGLWTVIVLVLMWRESAPKLAPARRRWMTRPMAAALLILIVIASGVSLGLPLLQKKLQSFRWARGTTSAASGFHAQTSGLGVVRNMKLRGHPILRLFGERQSGLHLRGMTYASFNGEHDRWQGTDWSKVDAEDGTKVLVYTEARDLGGYRYAPIPGSDTWTGETAQAEILLHSRYGGATRPSPLGLQSIRYPYIEDLMASDDGVVHVGPRQENIACRRYWIETIREDGGATVASSAVVPLPEEDRLLHVGADELIPDIVHTLAEQVAGGAETHLEAAQRIEAWLATSGEFEYTLEVPADYGVKEFLAPEGRIGWCEYYATSMALMLRARDVPCRYVAGFVVGEWNPIGGYYVVRAWDAHAWVEAWFPGVGWRTFDPTPPGMRRVEGENESGLLGGLRDWLGLMFGDVWRSFTEGDYLEALRNLVTGILSTLWRLFLQPIGLAITTVAFLLMITKISISRQRARRESVPVEDTRSAEVRQLQSSWRQVVAAARAHGLPVAPGDTPRQVLSMLRDRPTVGAPSADAVAPLVELIYSCRYGSEPLNMAGVERACERL